MRHAKILHAAEIYDGTGSAPFSGFVALSADGTIAGIGNDSELTAFLKTHPWPVKELGHAAITPGWYDSSVFFPGFVVQRIGCDLSKCLTMEECVEQMAAPEAEINGILFGHSAPPCALGNHRTELDRAFPDRPAVLLSHSRYACSMNTAAVEHLHFTEETCYSEAYAALFSALLADDALFDHWYQAFDSYLLSNGITAARDIAYDDMEGRPERIRRLQESDLIHVKLALVSQPNAAEPNFETLIRYQKCFQTPALRFTGLKLMVDDMTVFGNEDSFCRPKKQDAYLTLEQWVREADARGLRVSLHADGDRAVAWCVSLLSSLPHRRTLRHSIISASLIQDADAETIREEGLVLELYPTLIGALHENIVSADFIHKEFLQAYLTAEEQTRYLNYRRLAEIGVPLCCGSDLPYMPFGPAASVRYAVDRIDAFGQTYQPENGLTLPQLIQAWTAGGHSAIGLAGGVLQAGSPADLVVMNKSLSKPDAAVSETYVDGRLVYKAAPA